MTSKQKQFINNILVQVDRRELGVLFATDKICKYFDDQLSEVLSKEIQVLDLLNHFDLEIRSKE